MVNIEATTGIDMLRSWLGDEEKEESVSVEVMGEGKSWERTVKTHCVKMGLVDRPTAGNPNRNLHNSSSFVEIC